MIEKRYVILETTQGDCFETILPKGTSMADAIDEAENERWRVRGNLIRTVIELAVMDYDTETGEVDYSSYDLIDF